MISGFNISDHERGAIPSSVRVAALSLNHQLRLLHTRFDLHQQQFAAVKEKSAQAEHQRQTQAPENERLSGELARLREQLGINSSNSSLPPSSDSPFQKRKHNVQPSGLKQTRKLDIRERADRSVLKCLEQAVQAKAIKEILCLN